MKARNFICDDCRHKWDEPFGTGRVQECPSCKRSNVHRVECDCKADRMKGRRHHGQCAGNSRGIQA